METFSETHVNTSAVTPCAAANAAENGKRRKYAVLTVRFRFEPVTLETAGVFGKATDVLLKEIGRRMCEVTGNGRKTYWLEKRIVLAVQRGNALSLFAGSGQRSSLT